MSVATRTKVAGAGRAEAPRVADGAGEYLLTVYQFRAMANAGIFPEGDRVELLGGRVYRKMTKNPPHYVACGKLAAAFLRLVPPGYFADREIPVQLTDDWQPEPDGLIARGTLDDFADHYIGPADIALIVEVSDESSRRRDRGKKRRGYAEAGLPVYWIVDLVTRAVEVHEDPTGPAGPPEYRRLTTYRPGGEVPVVVGGREVARLPVDSILPPLPTPPGAAPAPVEG